MRYRSHSEVMNMDAEFKPYSFDRSFDMLVPIQDVDEMGCVRSSMKMSSVCPADLNKGLRCVDFELVNLIAVGALKDEVLTLDSCTPFDVVDSLK